MMEPGAALAVEGGARASARREACMDEAATIRAAQSGDAEAFERLVRSYDQQVLRLAMNLLRNPDDAHDVYQETFLRVFRNLGNFRFDCSFSTWLYRIATNQCLDLLRKRKVRRTEPAAVETEDGAVDRLEAAPDHRPSGDPQRAAWNRELQASIEQALAGLTPRERMVFELRHYQGMRLREIGEALGSSEEAAKNCLFRATQKMRQALGEFL
jgi:RNA polymerase sigma-70 factor (ECF subfamily)